MAKTIKLTARQQKLDFCSRFSADELRMARHNPNLVYQILKDDAHSVQAKLVWNDKTARKNGKIYNLPNEALRAFEKQTFIDLS